MTKKKETIISVALIAALLIVLYVLEQILPSTSMLFTVLKKGAIYALVAVSMNLLNGFTRTVLSGTGRIYASGCLYLWNPYHSGGTERKCIYVF